MLADLPQVPRWSVNSNRERNNETDISIAYAAAGPAIPDLDYNTRCDKVRTTALHDAGPDLVTTGRQEGYRAVLRDGR